MIEINFRSISLLVICRLFSTVITLRADDPCVNYTLNKEVARTTNYTYDGERPTCTTKPSSGRWYRFDNVSAGQITTLCPSGNVCGAGNKIWINATVPQLSDGEVTVTACVVRSSLCCAKQQPITMKACNGYFVYNIKVPLCSTVCIDENAAKPFMSTVATSEPPTTREITTSGINLCLKYENLTDGFSFMHTMVTGNTPQPSISFQKPGWYRFTSTVTGKIMNTCPQRNQCESKDAIWMNGTYDPDSPGLCSITLCLRTARNCCERVLHTKVMFCSRLPVYNLTPPIPGSTYCLDNTFDIELSRTTSSTRSSTPSITETTAITFSLSTTTSMTTTLSTTTLTSTPSTSRPTTSSTPKIITTSTSKIPKPTTTARTTTGTPTKTSSSTPTTPTTLTTSTSSSNTETTTSISLSSPTKSSEQISTGASTETITPGRSEAFPSTGLIFTTESHSSEAPAAKSDSEYSTEFIVAILCAGIIILGFVIATIIVKARNS